MGPAALPWADLSNMNILSQVTFITAFVLYASAALVVLVALLRKVEQPPVGAMGLAAIAWISHTVFIGTICVRTHHPPITNLPETATFIGWVIMAVEIVLFIRYRNQAAPFLVYPLVVMLLTVSAVFTEPFAAMPDEQRSRLFVAHILLTSVGVAALLIALAFGALYLIQDRAIKEKRRGTLYTWLPSLKMCDLVSYRSLIAGFAIYSAGIATGILWSNRTHNTVADLGAKEIGAAVAWVFFAAIMQAHIAGSFRSRRTAVFAILAFLSIVVSLLGIQKA